MADLNDLFQRKKEKMFVNQVISGSVFMTTKESYPIKIKGVDILSSKDKLQNLIWNTDVEVTKLYRDENDCILSEVYLNGEPLKDMLAS